MSSVLSVLVVEPWFTGSHRQWARGLAAHSAHDVRLITHDGQFWRWRLGGGALTLAELVAADVAAHGTPDVVVVSAMVDIAALLGFCRRTLHDVPVVAYFHENQLVYRGDPGYQPEQGPALTNWMSAAVADEVWFNSGFHREEFLAALPAFLDARPDLTHTHLVEAVAERSRDMPVGVDLSWIERVDTRVARAVGAAPVILWNHRWDHDKNASALFDVLRELAADGVDFRLALAGENSRTDPQEFDAICRDLGPRVMHRGHLDVDRYRHLLREADIVLSTALQEFFGIAVVEAIAAGCVPLLPNRLSYPNLIDTPYRPAVLYETDAALTTRLRDVLRDIEGSQRTIEGLAESMLRFDWRRVAPAYDEGLSQLVSRNVASDHPPDGATR